MNETVCTSETKAFACNEQSDEFTYNLKFRLIFTYSPLSPVRSFILNIGTQGVQELSFFVNNKPLKVANNACQSMVLPVKSPIFESP